jgi:hypothetical protein
VECCSYHFRYGPAPRSAHGREGVRRTRPWHCRYRTKMELAQEAHWSPLAPPPGRSRPPTLDSAPPASKYVTAPSNPKWRQSHHNLEGEFRNRTSHRKKEALLTVLWQSFTCLSFTSEKCLSRQSHSLTLLTTPWSLSASDRPLSQKVVPTSADRGCRVVPTAVSSVF